MSRHRSRIPEKILHRLFEVGITIKLIDGVLECIGGLLFLFVTQRFLYTIVVELTEHELLQDPNDMISNALLHAVATLPEGTKLFGALYLLLHGIVKVTMVIALWRDKLWAYPFSIAILVMFVVYQIYRFAHTHSAVLATFTTLDVIIIALIWHEWNYHHARIRKDIIGG